jgi:hypothetical protein
MQLFKLFQRDHAARVKDCALGEDLSDPVTQSLQKFLLLRLHCRIIFPEELHGGELSQGFDLLLFLIGHKAETRLIIGEGKFRARRKQRPRRVVV